MNKGNEQEKSVIFVTGGARRIGKHIACHLHNEGHDIALHCHHSRQEAHALATQLNQTRASSCQVFVADLAVRREIEVMMDDVITWNAHLRALVNNASLFYPTTQGSMDEQTWAQLFDVNVKACWLLSEMAFPYLAKSQGVIINLTDIHAEAPLRHHSVYCMSKAALLMQTKALALDYAPSVRVNAIAPGAILWPEGDNELSHAQKKAIIDKTPLKQHGKPEYIAKAVASLIDNPFITGQVLAVDGGRSLR